MIPRYTEEQTRLYLKWLAQGMISHGQSIFLIENLQPSWLPEEESGIWQPRSTTILWVVVMSVHALFLLFSLFWRSRVSPVETDGLVFAWLPFALAGGCIASLRFVLRRASRSADARIQPVARLVLPVRELLRSRGCLAGVGLLLALLLVGYLVYSTPQENWPAVVAVLVFLLSYFMLFLGPLLGILLPIVLALAAYAYFTAIRPIPLETSTSPNHGIHLSVLNGMKFLGVSLAALSAYVYLLGSLPPEFTGSGTRVMTYWCSGFLFFLFLYSAGRYGLLEVADHYLLRLQIYRRGYGPLDYAGFLGFVSHELGFIQKAGGGYIFLHRSLMEYFAERQDQP